MFTKIFTIIALMATLSTSPVEEQTVHMRAVYITNLDYVSNVVYCIDSVGFEWAFYGCEDYAEGDILCLLMSDNGTPSTILDDIILDVNYSGFWVETSEEISSQLILGYVQ